MVMWIFFGATLFVGFFILKGGQTFVADQILGTGLPPYGMIALMMVILFVLGMFLDWVGILLLTVPIFLPILKALNLDGLIGRLGVNPGHSAVVRRHLHGEHANGVFVAAVRLFPVLPQERGAAGRVHGDYHPGCGAFSGPPAPRGDALHPVPAHRDVVAELTLR